MSTTTTTPDPGGTPEPFDIAVAFGGQAHIASTQSVAIGASSGFEVEHPEETEINDPIFAASRLGATVRYTLSEHDVKVIVERRIAQGTAAYKGNPPRAGQSYAALIVRDWADPALRAKLREAEHQKRWGAPGEPTVADALTEEQYVKGASCNLQVFLDGNDTYWATSRSLYQADYHTSTRGHFIDRWIGHNLPLD